MKRNIYLVSDCHVKSRLWTNFAAVQGDAYMAMRKMASETDPSSVLISCGDLLDSNRPSNVDLAETAEFLNHFHRVLYIAGNHDDCQPSIVPVMCPYALHLTPDAVVREGNLVICGIDWQRSREAFLECLAQAAQTLSDETRDGGQPVLIMHQAVHDFLSIDGASMCTAKEILDTVGQDVLVYSGDIHVTQYVASVLGKGRVQSPGPLVPQDTLQARRQQFYWQLDSDTGVPSQHPVSVRSFAFLDSAAPDFDLAASLDALDRSLELPPVAILQVHGDYVPPKSQLNRDDCIVVVRTERTSTEASATEESSVTTLEEAITQEIEATEPLLADVLKPLADRLTTADKPDELLSTLLTNWEVTT